MIDISIKAKNYKCFGEKPQGFDEVYPINIIIGRNNSGKSSLLDLIAFHCNSFDISKNQHKGKVPQVIYKTQLQESDLRRVFEKNAAGGPIPGNHWEFGKNLIDTTITFCVSSESNKELIELDATEDVFRIARKTIELLLKNITIPLRDKKFIRLRAERDINPEEVGKNYDISDKGDGVTSLISSFITKASLPSDLVEKVMLEHLNKIVYPDLKFSRILVQVNDTHKWEVFLEEDGKGRISLSESGSGLKTLLLVLVSVLLIPKNMNSSLDKLMFGFEELENNLHPAIQRNLFLYLKNLALEQNSIFFITTHSNVVIDMFSNISEAQIVHIKHGGEVAECSKVQAFIHRADVLDDLDIRASDLLQSNCVVWVEGPSDRLYFNKWMEIYSNNTIREGLHYQCMFYGGRLLSHISAITDDDDAELKELIRILLINRNSIIIIDSDKRNNQAKINKTKKRILEEFNNIDALAWVTKGKEIENYIPKEAISRYFKKKVENPIEQYQEFSDYLEKLKTGDGKKFLSKKVLFAEKISTLFEKKDLDSVLDLATKMEEVINKIKNWNGM